MCDLKLEAGFSRDCEGHMLNVFLVPASDLQNKSHANDSGCYDPDACLMCTKAFCIW